MKNLIQSTALVVLLSSFSSTTVAAKNNLQFENGPRCEPFPECLMNIDHNKKDIDTTNLSEIYRFDKLLNIYKVE